MAASQVSAASAAGGDGDGLSSAVPATTASSSSSATSASASSISASAPAATASAAPSKSATPQADATTTTLPTRDKDSLNKVIIERFQTRDWIHSAALKEAQMRLEKDSKDMLARASDYRQYRDFYAAFPARLYGDGYRGYANGYTENGTTTKIIYPSQKPRPGRRAAPALKFSKKDVKKQAEQHEELVPVRIDIEGDKIKLRDTFTFNLHERLVSVELLAVQFMEDMGLNPSVEKPVFDQVVQQIHEQLNDFYPFAYAEEDALDPELPYSAYKNDEMRILIKINITIGGYTLIDQFEWDINNPMNSPEEFAMNMARDLSLSGEFTTAIAHCIREQTQLFTRSLYSIGHPFDGRPVEDADLLAAFLPSPIPSVFRPQQQAKDYGPYMYDITEAELEKVETTFSREQRRQKRSINRRGGPQLPDLKERQRTMRTPIVSSVLPGAALHIDDSRLFKRTQASGLAGRGRKAARDGEVSDSDESDESAPDSPAMSQLQGTARTRGIRGAASAATQRMANIGRSETPEAIIHHHETRTSRRFGRETTREQTEEPLQRRVVVLKVNPAKLKKLMRDLRARQPAPPYGTPTLAHQRAPSAAAASSMGPPSTPSAPPQNLPPRPNTAPSLQGQIGRVPAPPPGPTGNTPNQPPPSPPDWLTTALSDLLKSYPTDSFEAIMRYCAINTETNAFVSLPLPPPAAGEPAVPPHIQFAWLPRIRCRDCPGKSYTAGPETTVQNFEVHLKNRAHRERVVARLGKGAAAGGGAALVAQAAP